jgi:dTDP-4-dehydrorhamnose 3,5-epimerase
MPARFTARPLRLADVLLVTPTRMSDSRGYFIETYQAEEFPRIGISAAFVQDNEAGSTHRGTIRGLHFQKAPHAQAKLVRVLRGAIFDVAVDIRAGSATFGQWVGARLDAEAGEQLFVPRGFAHGYCTLTDEAVVAYKCDNLYCREAEGGIHFADPALAIAWPVAAASAIISDKDRALPGLAAFAGAVDDGALRP